MIRHNIKPNIPAMLRTAITAFRKCFKTAILTDRAMPNLMIAVVGSETLNCYGGKIDAITDDKALEDYVRRGYISERFICSVFEYLKTRMPALVGDFLGLTEAQREIIRRRIADTELYFSERSNMQKNNATMSHRQYEDGGGFVTCIFPRDYEKEHRDLGVSEQEIKKSLVLDLLHELVHAYEACDKGELTQISSSNFGKLIGIEGFTESLAQELFPILGNFGTSSFDSWNAYRAERGYVLETMLFHIIFGDPEARKRIYRIPAEEHTHHHHHSEIINSEYSRLVKNLDALRTIFPLEPAGCENPRSRHIYGRATVALAILLLERVIKHPELTNALKERRSSSKFLDIAEKIFQIAKNELPSFNDPESWNTQIDAESWNTRLGAGLQHIQDIVIKYAKVMQLAIITRILDEPVKIIYSNSTDADLLKLAQALSVYTGYFYTLDSDTKLCSVDGINGGTLTVGFTKPIKLTIIDIDSLKIKSGQFIAVAIQDNDFSFKFIRPPKQEGNSN